MNTSPVFCQTSLAQARSAARHSARNWGAARQISGRGRVASEPGVLVSRWCSSPRERWSWRMILTSRPSVPGHSDEDVGVIAGEDVLCAAGPPGRGGQGFKLPSASPDPPDPMAGPCRRDGHAWSARLPLRNPCPRSRCGLMRPNGCAGVNGRGVRAATRCGPPGRRWGTGWGPCLSPGRCCSWRRRSRRRLRR